MTNKSDAKEISLNNAFKRLEEITTQIEDDSIDLEQSIPLLKEGLELAKIIKTRLTTLENEIEEVKGKYSLDENTDLEEDDSGFSF